MARKTVQKAGSEAALVTFDFQERTYQLDPNRRKVYRRFVEIETSKALEILSIWRARHVSA